MPHDPEGGTVNTGVVCVEGVSIGRIVADWLGGHVGGAFHWAASEAPAVCCSRVFSCLASHVILIDRGNLQKRNIMELIFGS